jgi:hypothetical protein
VPKLWHEEAEPSGVMHDTEVTGPEGNTVSLDEAVKNGWLALSAPRFSDKYKMSYPASGSFYKLSNKTTKPIRIRIPSGSGKAITPKTVDIPPGETQQLETTTASSLANIRSLMPVVVSVLLSVFSS